MGKSREHIEMKMPFKQVKLLLGVHQIGTINYYLSQPQFLPLVVKVSYVLTVVLVLAGSANILTNQDWKCII